MQRRNGNVYLNPKHKIVYMAATCGLATVVLLLLTVLTLMGNDLVSTNDSIFYYCTALYLLLTVAAMIVDESIKKYPGLLVLCATSIYSFCYVSICFIKGGQSILGYVIISLYLIYIVLSYLLYKKMYPIIAVNNKIKSFNTLYLIVLVMFSIIFGFMYCL